MNAATPPTAAEALNTLWRFCVDRDWTGWDPYDGLMARRPPATWLLNSRAGRLLLIQGMKRSPLNLRPLLGVPPLRNPKAMALGLLAAARLAERSGWRDRALPEARRLVRALLDAAVPTAHGRGWGYPFDWQARAFLIPRGTPTVVCTGFVVRALDRTTRSLGPLLDEDGHLGSAVDAAIADAARFVLHDLHRTVSVDGFCFSYSPLDRSEVVNATLLGAETVGRHAARIQDHAPWDAIRPTIAWSLARQQPNGGWSYGQAGHHGWEDAFHTGFNLASLRALRSVAERLGDDPETSVPAERLQQAYRHYAESFFDPDGRPWYYSHTPWPIDPHAAAVAILTHRAFASEDPRANDAAQRVLDWSLRRLWNRRGWFNFQLQRWGTIRIPYLRWTQAWMLHALAEWSEPQ